MKQLKDWFTFIMMIGFLAVFYLFFFIAAANAQEVPPHVIKGHMTHEDDKQWYHLQTLSDGTERVHTVRKPAPVNPIISRQIIETNDLPVQVQYAYRELYADLTVRTNWVTRVKQPTERLNIKLPPMPEIPETKPRGKSDALRLAQQRRKSFAAKSNARVIAPTSRVSMSRPDRIIKSEIQDNVIKHTYESGNVVYAPLKKAFTARVKTAPLSASHESHQK